MKTLTERKNRKGERGSVLAISALSMLGLLLATGLAVDISHLYTAKAELQNAADASALAAASQLNSTSGGIKSAVYQAKQALNNYDFKNSVALTDADVTFGRNLNDPTYMSAASAELTPSTIRFVKVTIPPKPVGIAFSAAVLGSSTNVAATATAGLSVGLTMNKFYTAYAFIESAAAPIKKGDYLILDAKAGNSNSPTSYRVLQGPSGDLITTGTIHAYGEVGDSYTIANLSQAEMCRYARIGVNTRFGDYSTSLHPNINPTDEPPDQFTEETLTYKDYTDKQGANPAAPGVKNRRVMTLPIAMNTTYNTTSRTVVANRLAAFFIKKKVDTDCKLHVEYIGAPIAVPVGTFDPNGAGIGDLSIPVLYK
jgi:Flp pilus assembly protein TadG